ncbi:DUF924 domain-containing protein [Rhodovarius crocodyli]|uniref:DUF924 domain-containing protein n=1 Tax=Rhodovarius crocodyli TaxID=1979269 RepID=A0A437MJK5_9PROT|nr:DUF924 family protein [Rhodovarius crocodyli]RVT97854.1 DUF924 domain-containing protein [Rhodovarius crocodyli]
MTSEDVLSFWFSEGPDTHRPAWFQKNDAFDDSIRQQFGALVVPAREGALDGWAETPLGALALLIVLDQFPRNLFRGSAEAFASDAHARDIARAVVAKGWDMRVTCTQRSFLYLPFEHSESMADQHLSVALFEGMRDDRVKAAPGGSIDYAWRHWFLIRDFGRFPHRNAALARTSTSQEVIYLSQPGAGF